MLWGLRLLWAMRASKQSRHNVDMFSTSWDVVSDMTWFREFRGLDFLQEQGRHWRTMGRGSWSTSCWHRYSRKRLDDVFNLGGYSLSSWGAITHCLPHCITSVNMLFFNVIQLIHLAFAFKLETFCVGLFQLLIVCCLSLNFPTWSGGSYSSYSMLMDHRPVKTSETNKGKLVKHPKLNIQNSLESQEVQVFSGLWGASTRGVQTVRASCSTKPGSLGTAWALRCCGLAHGKYMASFVGTE